MRNEAHNITKTLPKILNQSSQNIQFIFINDKSTDNTQEVLEQITKKHQDKDIIIIQGTPLPKGWVGKQWALHQAQQYATGDILLFVDADVLLHKDAMRSLLQEFNETESDMLSVFPKQVMKTWGEKIATPLQSWALLTFYPLVLATSKLFPQLAVANGQVIMISKEAYQQVGGHEAVKGSMVEDIALAEKVKQERLNLNLCFGAEMISCRMYQSLNSAWAGYSKNYFTATKLPKAVFLIVIPLLYFFHIISFLGWIVYYPLITLLAARVIKRVALSRLTGENSFLAVLLHPLQITFFVFVGINSFFQTNFGKVSWKGRKYGSGK